MKKNIEESKIWLDKAKDDLLWTQHNLEAGVYYGACFTAQQAAEKALKAYLIYKEGRFDKIHDLVELLNRCFEIDKDFLSMKEKASRLSYYYIHTRYPDIFDLDRYSKDDALQALSESGEIVNLVGKKMQAE